MTIQEELSEILKDEDSLKEFVLAMKDFNQAFCDAMASRVDYTIKLEVRGNQGVMLHAKVDSGRWRRPKGVEKIVEQRSRKNNFSK